MAVCVRLAAREMTAVQIAFFRFFGSLVILLLATRGRGLRPVASGFGLLVVRGLIGAAAISLYFAGIRSAGAGIATLVQNTYPVFATAFAVVFLGEAFSARLAAALSLNLVGIAVVLGPDLVRASPQSFGIVCALGSAVLAGGAVVTARYLRRNEGASVITTYFMAVGAIVTLPSLLAGLPPLTPTLSFAVVGVVVTSVAGQWLLHHGLGFTSASQASLTAATSVVTAATFSALLLGEHFSATTVAGACFMISAVGLSTRMKAES